MDARFYNSEDIDIERLANDMTNIYLSQGYQAQQIGNKDQMLLQLKKGGDFEAIIGMQAAVSLTLQRTAGGVLAMIGQQRWIDKAAVGAVGIVAFPVLWPLALTAGVGTLRQASLGNQVLNMVDGLVRQQRPNIVGGPVPMQLMPQVQQQWAPPPYAQTPAYIPPPQVVVSQAPTAAIAPPRQSLRCANCNTPYEAGDTFCSGCGRSLAPAKVLCPNCNTELKPGVAFCPKCGSSTFQANKSAAPTYAPQMAPPSAPPSRPPTPMYTPPPASRPPTPVYTPPPASRPPTPVYTPPATPVYTPPSPPTIEPHAAPTVASDPVQPKPPEPYYIPPATQEPPVAPPTTISYVQSTVQKPATPATPPRPQKQYYIPSEQSQQAAAQPTIADQPAQKPEKPATPPQQQYYVPSEQIASQPTLQNQPIAAKPATNAAADANAAWGIVVFEDSSQVELMGERAIVGRADHDLGGEPPDVDLSQKQGSDTVSRIHAVLEHIGSSYTLTDLNSTNATKLNGKRLEPDKAAPLNDGDALLFGKVAATFKKA
ncbi:MAG TPA: FHA domain-containing protein [Ktedonobacteraceae bacterium]|nr:FHA domain-containing protein [Ktedonobacteraceae bacterium]